MSESSQPYDKSLRVLPIKENKAAAPRGLYTRRQLTKIFSDYVYAHLHTAKAALPVVPTIMFIFSEPAAPEAAPVAVPFNISSYDIEHLEGFIALMLQQYHPDIYQLEMILYARFAPDYQDMPEHKIMFGAKDISGSTAHTVYTCSNDRGVPMKHYQMSAENFDCWAPPRKGVRDDYLASALNSYFTLVSFSRLSSHVK